MREMKMEHGLPGGAVEPPFNADADLNSLIEEDNLELDAQQFQQF